ncbi:hypothetical protein REPUB_Repub02eG0058500 [Reevesia pubescens]
MKVYFANPRDLIVYYVTDFVYKDFGVSPILFNVGCVLVGSRIYIIGGQRPYCTGYTKDVYFCDVAQPLLDGGGYEWMKAPSLNFDKAHPMTFSLSSKIYALSVDDQWQKVKMKDANLLDDLPIDVTYSVDVVDTCFLFDKLWKFYVLHFGHENPSSSFSHPTRENLVGDNIGLENWQLVQLTGTKFCFISFYNSNAPLECRVRLCTFDFVMSFGADEQDSKGQKFAHYFVTSPMFFGTVVIS